ncbi:EAL domain-containing response regulator [Aeromonas jandaei]|uniref:EAL domain-containing response regulator n=2 Tax=Aeromonadaceae TaxID=84642 RepID=A0ABX6ZRY2_AERJA|nr:MULTISPECIES: EAL domain-containing response regulator [Aeromonas]BBQ51887.1 transcriptional regulator [Aeromonas veronii]MBL0597635.1 EAL domain-containing response regulator [Aeromonas jandaei]MBL0609530.1 EAL domain-containing response regulator [Aeromonas jandaei]MBL0667256.1 EAL domain-containing response regulator [Aeromonas jandaei]MBW3760996.1 EAL domain-containing response regulator [Aeromonas jandaei]
MNNVQNVHDELVIMVVEDHAFQRKALMHQIRDLGYQQLLEARDGQEALELCQRHSVDILFCDLRMPGMDGMALLRRLSLGGFSGGIILSSALEDDVVEAVLRMSAAYGLQVLGRIEKPSTKQQLKVLIESWSPRQEQAQKEDGHRLGLDELRRALDDDQIVPWYQPKVSFATGEWVGMEALARWQHPEYGLVSPGRFIPLAENNGLIDQLTEIIINKSLRDGHLWEETGLSLNLSMNLSTTSLIEGDLCNSLIAQCQRWSINPELITLEVTESSFVQDVGKSLEVLTRLRMHGFGLSIDDFGTGYSSMQQLALLPFTELKLDRSFVDRCYADPSRLAIIESSIELARKLGLKSVAEGVEDELTWQQLAKLGCDVCQGFFSARPMPRSELQEWHRSWQERLPTLISI